MAQPKHENQVSDDTSVEEFDINDPSLRCGIGSFRPWWAVKLADIRVFVPLYSLAAMMSSSLGIYIISQVTTFEKLLGLSSKDTGFLLSANDIGYLIVIVFASHFSRNANKPFIIGTLIALFGVMAMLCAVPHSIMYSHKDLFYYDPDANDEFSDAENTTSHVNMCNANREQSSATVGNVDDTIVYVRRVSFTILALCMMIQGSLKAPRYPLSLTYIDDHVPKTKVGLYVGITVAIIIFGLAIATGLGSLFSRMYVTLQDVGLSIQDPRWVGAWWLGFVVIGSTSCVVSIPLLFFPKYLKTNHKYERKEEKDVMLLTSDETDAQDAETAVKPRDTKDDKITEMDGLPLCEDRADKKTVLHGKELLKQEFKEFPKSMIRLLKNPVFVCILAANGIGMTGNVGRIVYFPKYLEVHFNMLAHEAILMFGITILVGASLGSIISGILMSALKMSPKSCFIFIVVFGMIPSCLSFAGLGLPCPQTQYQGYDLNRLNIEAESLPQTVSGKSYDTNTTCADTCQCTDGDYLPICGDDGLTYFSPCHAGCSQTSRSSNIFSNCTCMSESSNHTAVSGQCRDHCWSRVPYLVVSFLGPLLGMLTLTPKVVVKLRCVSDEDRSLSVGVNAFLTNLLGSFLSPIIYGGIIDTSCKLWISGSCRIYDIADFRNKLHATSGTFGIASDLLYILATFIVIFSKRYSKSFEDTNQKKH